jgi:hypothetical protein
MNKFLITEGCVNSISNIYIVEASNTEKACRLAAKKLFKLDKFFIEYLKECTVNMSFAEKFWFQKENEQNYFCEHHELLIDFNEFQNRVKNYFGSCADAAQDYISFWTLTCDGHEKEAFIAFENFIKSAEDFLIKEYIDFTEIEAIDISKIAKL